MNKYSRTRLGLLYWILSTVVTIGFIYIGLAGIVRLTGAFLYIWLAFVVLIWVVNTYRLLFAASR